MGKELIALITPQHTFRSLVSRQVCSSCPQGLGAMNPIMCGDARAPPARLLVRRKKSESTPRYRPSRRAQAQRCRPATHTQDNQGPDDDGTGELLRAEHAKGSESLYVRKHRHHETGAPAWRRNNVNGFQCRSRYPIAWPSPELGSVRRSANCASSHACSLSITGRLRS